MRLFLAASLLVAVLLEATSAKSLSDGRVNMAQAKVAFDRLSNRDRNELYLMLIATGDFNAMVGPDFGNRLYDSIVSFQQSNGLIPSGVFTKETADKLTEVGGRIFNSWGFAFFDHPTSEASLAIPAKFGLIPSPTPKGIAFQNPNHTMAIDFAYFPSPEAGLNDIFERLTQPSPGRRVDYKVVRSNFFAIAGGTDTTSNYSRYISVQGGIAGFTISWNTSAFPNGSRVAVIMANELYARRMVANPKSTPNMFETTPNDNDPPSEQERQPDLEQQRRDQEEAEAARKDAIQKLQKERFERVAASANHTIDEASAFVKDYPGDKSLIAILQQISSLHQTLSGNDPDLLDKLNLALNASLQHDVDFLSFEKQRQDAHVQQEAQTAVDAAAYLKKLRQFLINVVRQNPISDDATNFLLLVKQADAALSSQELTQLLTVIGHIDFVVQNEGLEKQFKASQLKPAQLD